MLIIILFTLCVKEEPWSSSPELYSHVLLLSTGRGREHQQAVPPLCSELQIDPCQNDSSNENEHLTTCTCTLPCKAKRQYLLTLQVSRSCLLALQSSTVGVDTPTQGWFNGGPAWYTLGQHWADIWVNVRVLA